MNKIKVAGSIGQHGGEGASVEKEF